MVTMVVLSILICYSRRLKSHKVGSVTDPHHVDADPDPDLACNFGVDPDPTFHFDEDPDPSFQIKA
jgi:hypothetical protein